MRYHSISVNSRVVQPAALEAAHHVADLVDVAAAGGEQALHRVLGRGVQIERRAAPEVRTRAEWMCTSLTGAIDEERGVHLEHAARGEERARRAQRAARALEHARGVARRTPVGIALMGARRRASVLADLRSRLPAARPGSHSRARAAAAGSRSSPC